MKREDDGKETFEFEEPDKKVEIGTEILDPSLPSNLDFQKKPKEYEGNQVDSTYSKKKQEQLMQNAGESIRTFTIKGKKNIQDQPQFLLGSIIKGDNIGFQVKAYDEEKSGGWKSLWEGIVGYVKRQLLISNGYVYLFQKVSDGLMVKSAWKLSQLFKVFVDTQDQKIRLVLRLENDQHRLLTKNFSFDKYEQFIQKMEEEVGKAGLMLISQ